MKKLSPYIILLLLVCLSGCSTILAREKNGFGHVYIASDDSLNNGAAANTLGIYFPPLLILTLPLSIIDLAVALVTDTLLLPVDLLATPRSPYRRYTIQGSFCLDDTQKEQQPLMLTGISTQQVIDAGSASEADRLSSDELNNLTVELDNITGNDLFTLAGFDGTIDDNITGLYGQFGDAATGHHAFELENLVQLDGLLLENNLAHNIGENQCRR